ncbi:MAG: Rieske 2Fe-2S domain-containing protein [Chloroflexi bacterium]|nr:MAG: Rieske 2Fe-2S domain-containing protein [Chloroflexota bacterium]
MELVTPSRTVRYNLGPVSRIPLGEGRTYRVANSAVAVFQTRDGQLFATQALCPHKAGPLSDGIVGACQVICPLHAYKFDLRTGAALGNTCEALQTYPVALNEDGDILLSLDH